MMEKEDKHSLLQPLIPVFSPSSYSQEINFYDTANKAKLFSSEHNIILRILLILFIALISVWANYEASKTFDINIVNDTKDSPAGRRFTLFYVSNDKATRILLNTSSFVEHLLYPNNNNPNTKKKRIESITLRLARRNLNNTAVTVTGNSFNRYVIEISPILLDDENFDKTAIVGEIQRAMVQVWLWDGGSTAPLGLLNGMAEYVAELAGYCRSERLGYCENYKEGFIRRLNEAMRDTWHDRMMDDALGMSASNLCGMDNVSWLDVTHNRFN